MKNEFLWIKKRKRTAVLVAGKTKQRKNEKKTGEKKKKKNVTKKQRTQRTSGGFPNKQFLCRQLRNYGLRGGRIRRAYPPKWARSK